MNESMGTAWGKLTLNGTGGKPVTFTVEEMPMFSRYTIFRLHFGLGGFDMDKIVFKKIKAAEGTGLSVEDI